MNNNTKIDYLKRSKYSDCVRIVPMKAYISDSAQAILCHHCERDLSGTNPIKYVDGVPICIKCMDVPHPIDSWKNFSDELPERNKITLIFDKTNGSFTLKFDVLWDILESKNEHKQIGTHWQYVVLPLTA